MGTGRRAWREARRALALGDLEPGMDQLSSAIMESEGA